MGLQTEETIMKRQASKRQPQHSAHAQPVAAPHVPMHPRSVPTIETDADPFAMPDQPFAEGASDTLDADLRHRLISESSFRRYEERGFAEGYDVDDWRDAEADVDHILLNPATEEKPSRGRR
jgi:hypothetical protein